jgi:hypothetical protein
VCDLIVYYDDSLSTGRQSQPRFRSASSIQYCRQKAREPGDAGCGPIAGTGYGPVESGSGNSSLLVGMQQKIGSGVIIDPDGDE